jgi:sulfate transport system ATP-binding protein
VNRLDGQWVRPHDVELRHEPNGSTREAQVLRIVRLGFEARVELERDDGQRLHAQLTVDELDLLELRAGDIVFVRTRRARIFG